jgi:hypothetical protein
MTHAQKNVYAEWMSSDNDLCVPVLSREQISFIELAVAQTAAMTTGGELPKAYPPPRYSLDLEHIQIADYLSFPGVTKEQRNEIARLHSEYPIPSEELFYISLKSLFGQTFQFPKTEEELLLACECDAALDRILLQIAGQLSGEMRELNARLPYWGRYSFLRVMAQLPQESVHRLGLDRVAVTLIRRPKFNATSRLLKEGALIGLNHALEPILKHLNRYLLAFFHTREAATARRMERAFKDILPVVFHFWGSVSLVSLHAMSIIFDEKEHERAHRLTADQLDFIVAHELGHIARNHAKELVRRVGQGEKAAEVRHELEYAADRFAVEYVITAFKTIREEREAANLLFTYMDFIQRMGSHLLTRLGSGLNFRGAMDSHPQPADRLHRVNQLFGAMDANETELSEYARTFFSDVLAYAGGLSEDALRDVIQRKLGS